MWSTSLNVYNIDTVTLEAYTSYWSSFANVYVPSNAS